MRKYIEIQISVLLKYQEQKIARAKITCLFLLNDLEFISTKQEYLGIDYSKKTISAITSNENETRFNEINLD
jgi:hypothetical protein